MPRIEELELYNFEPNAVRARIVINGTAIEGIVLYAFGDLIRITWPDVEISETRLKRLELHLRRAFRQWLNLTKGAA